MTGHAMGSAFFVGPVYRWHSTIWPSSGPRRWSDGATVGPSRAFMDAAASIAPRSSRLRGSCIEAEKEAVLACEELRPYLRRELGWPLTELGRIRLHTGDIQGAEEAFLAAHEVGWDPQPGLSLVHLAQGDVESAAASIRDALDHPLNVRRKSFRPATSGPPAG